MDIKRAAPPVSQRLDRLISQPRAGMELDAADLVAGIVALLLSGVGVLHALRVDDDKAWTFIAPMAMSRQPAF